jgi:uncharacterized protein (TIGR00255 family)
MLQSMTGFGRATGEWENKKITVEIRSLNSKQMDLNLKMPGLYKEKEIELRNFLAKELIRGKVDVCIFSESVSEDKNHIINKNLAHSYYQDLKTITEETGITGSDYLKIIMCMPDIMKAERQELKQAEWDYIMTLISQSVKEFEAYRKSEGQVLEQELIQRIGLILANLEETESLDVSRKENVRERIEKGLKEFVEKGSVDKNRFEQELIYYLEKLDITEEKVRLRLHCRYFIDTVSQGNSEGRKLGFIAQEIGREVNTIGSKSNDASIQKLVVMMKDDLEKIKEQVLNIL